MSQESDKHQLENFSLRMFQQNFSCLISNLFRKRFILFVFALFLSICVLLIFSSSFNIYAPTKRIIAVLNVSQAHDFASNDSTTVSSPHHIHDSKVMELSNTLALDVGLGLDCLQFAKQMAQRGIWILNQLKDLSEAKAVEVLQGSGMNELQIHAVMKFIALLQTSAADPILPATSSAPGSQPSALVSQSMLTSAPLQQESLSRRTDNSTSTERRFFNDSIFNGLKQYPTIPKDRHEFFDSLRDLLLLCNPYWIGIRTATLNQGAPVVEVPGVSSAAESDDLVKFIAATRVKRIVINGVPQNMIDFARQLKKQIPDMSIYFIYHGTLVQHLLEPHEAVLVDQLIQGNHEGYIQKIGFVKSGVAAFVSSLGIKAYSVSNFQPSAPPLYGIKLRELDSHVHIGIFGDGGWIKNLIVQLAAACMMENVVIHVIFLPATPYFKRCRAQVVLHGFMSQRRFFNFMGQVDVTMYVSLSESFPMTVMESLSLGVPCLTSNTHGLFNIDPFLKQYLVVPEHDNPEIIQKAILRVLEQRDELVPRFESFLACLNLRARSQFDFFVDRTPQLLVPSCPLYNSAVKPSNATSSLNKVVRAPFFLPVCFIILV
jgi:hypothetical protein